MRLHLNGHDQSLEGILAGTVAGHYRLLKPELLETSERTHQLDGEVWVARDRVMFLQVLS